MNNITHQSASSMSDGRPKNTSQQKSKTDEEGIFLEDESLEKALEFYTSGSALSSEIASEGGNHEPSQVDESFQLTDGDSSVRVSVREEKQPMLDFSNYDLHAVSSDCNINDDDDVLVLSPSSIPTASRPREKHVASTSQQILSSVELSDDDEIQIISHKSPTLYGRKPRDHRRPLRNSSSNVNMPLDPMESFEPEQVFPNLRMSASSRSEASVYDRVSRVMRGTSGNSRSPLNRSTIRLAIERILRRPLTDHIRQLWQQEQEAESLPKPPAPEAQIPEKDDSGLSSRGFSDVKCPICWDPMNKMMATICGHVFCANCITREIQARKRCPTCQQKLTIKKVHPLFM